MKNIYATIHDITIIYVMKYAIAINFKSHYEVYDKCSPSKIIIKYLNIQYNEGRWHATNPGKVLGIKPEMVLSKPRMVP